MDLRLLTKEKLPACAGVIRAGFADTATRFGLTEQNCPTHGAFLRPGRLEEAFCAGKRIYGCFCEGVLAGCAVLTPCREGVCELEKLAVLPAFRRAGCGAALVERCKAEARVLGAGRLTCAIIAENRALGAWYGKLGFLPTGTRKFAHLPFTVGFLECPLGKGTRLF
ncbi:MAG: GNAT family N-acetyltransferase [Eubacteriales bacterium]|nr:GNAT family N-acetyltransferase [Eubacteriales bacterium]